MRRVSRYDAIIVAAVAFWITEGLGTYQIVPQFYAFRGVLWFSSVGLFAAALLLYIRNSRSQNRASVDDMEEKGK